MTAWSAGAIGGLVAGVVFGIFMQSMGVISMVGALVGMPSLVVGWIVHLVISLAFGLVFAALVTTGALGSFASTARNGAVVGIAYGVVIWFVAAAVVMPLWLAALGFPAPAVPNVDPNSLAGHLVYGLVLGGLYPIIARSMETTTVEDRGSTA
jgi:hypothetical protein